MNAKARPLLICRPEPGAAATAERAQNRGLHPLLYPLFSIGAVPWDTPAPTDFDVLMLTSANSLRYGGANLALYHSLPVYAVGPTTARAAAAHGFASIITAGPDVQATITHIARDGHNRVLHLCGADVRAYDPGALSVTQRPVYSSVEQGSASGLKQVIQQEPSRPPVIMVHSPRAGDRLRQLITSADRATLSLIAISATTAATTGTGWSSILVADTPDDTAMLAIACQICQ